MSFNKTPALNVKYLQFCKKLLHKVLINNVLLLINMELLLWTYDNDRILYRKYLLIFKSLKLLNKCQITKLMVKISRIFCQKLSLVEIKFIVSFSYSRI